MTVWRGIGLGVALWLVMQVVWLPYVGWGAFGTAHTPKIAIATLILHLIYGATLGWLIDRKTGRAPERGRPPDHVAVIWRSIRTLPPVSL